MSTYESPGVPPGEVGSFLVHLEVTGSSSYTDRSYRLGLADFDRWLVSEDLALVAVGKAAVTRYIDAYARGQWRNRRGESQPRAERTVNHRLSVLASFFAFLIERDTHAAAGDWLGRVNPVPESAQRRKHGMVGRDLPGRRRRAELRRRAPRRLPVEVDPKVMEMMIAAAPSRRDQAILVLLARTGQRIGDWSDEHGRHGILGMSLADFDRRRSTIVVRLKGSRDEHRVPVMDDFWPMFDRYLETERGETTTAAAWVGSRRGRGRPLRYEAFEAAVRLLGGRLGVKVTAHMFRHTVAQGVVETAGLKVAQELLGHQHVGTTADIYSHVDHEAMVEAVSAVDLRRRGSTDGAGVVPSPGIRYAFAYDATTIETLESIAGPRLVGEESR